SQIPSQRWSPRAVRVLVSTRARRLPSCGHGATTSSAGMTHASNALVGGQKLARVAVTRDPAQAIPVSGTWTGAPSDFLGMTLNVEAIPRDDASGPGAVGRRRFRASPDSRPAPIVVGRSPPKD